MYSQTQVNSLRPALTDFCACGQVFEWPCDEEGEGLSDVLSPHIQRLQQFARTVPGKNDDHFHDLLFYLNFSRIRAGILYISVHADETHEMTPLGPSLYCLTALLSLLL